MIPHEGIRFGCGCHQIDERGHHLAQPRGPHDSETEPVIATRPPYPPTKGKPSSLFSPSLRV